MSPTAAAAAEPPLLGEKEGRVSSLGSTRDTKGVYVKV